MPENLPPNPESVEQPPEPQPASANLLKSKAVKFLHEKTPGYHIIHVDGAWGSINSIGNVQLDFYAETALTPDAVVQPLDPDGNFTGEHIPLGRVESETLLVVRNIQCGIVLSLNSAIQIQSVLQSFIDSSKKQFEMAVEQLKKNK
jgi:hypothetical protein